MRIVKAVSTVVLVAALLALAGCPGCPPPTPPAGPSDADAGLADAAPEVTPPPTCYRACENVWALGCDPGGSCLRLCDSIGEPGFRFCLLTAADCYEVNRCDTPGAWP